MPFTIAAMLAVHQSQAAWQTTAERTAFRQTGTYAEAVEFCSRLDKASENAVVVKMGLSPQGREMVALILSKEPGFRSGKSANKPVVLVQNGIHSGEIEGKDACMMLARDMVVGNAPLSGLLDEVNLVILPVFSLDAHERRSPYNRANQNGPEEMGWRATAQNLNLNRDYIKADGGEMRLLLEKAQIWKPDFFIDNHTTDGGDWQYVVQYDVPVGPCLDSEVSDVSKKFVKDVMPQVDGDGFLTAPYFGGFSYANPERGISLSTFGPRYSTGYFSMRNTPSLLVETHVLKPYEARVKGTYSINLRTFQWVAKNAKGLLGATRGAADRAKALKVGSDLVVTNRTAQTSRPFTFRGLEYAPNKSEISGGTINHWTDKKVDIQTTIRDEQIAGLAVKLPAAYLVPRAWTDVVDRLKLHGIQFSRVKASQALDSDVQLFVEPKLGTATFEGRQMPTYGLKPSKRKIQVMAGDLVVPVGQPLTRLVAQMLEPSAPDSFAKWGFFNVVFEEKEYAEDYALEPIAKKMLASDPALKAEFEERLNDPAFANNPNARLRFFFERSPYFDDHLNVYPILRLDQSEANRLLEQ